MISVEIEMQQTLRQSDILPQSQSQSQQKRTCFLHFTFFYINAIGNRIAQFIGRALHFMLISKQK